MKYKLVFSTFFVVAIIIFIAGCVREKINPIDSPLIFESPISISSLIPSDGRQQTALAAYTVAEPVAKRWNKQALLYQIPPTRIMEMNLGIPAGIAGWFFMFKSPDSPVEYYINIVDGNVFGITEAQPILVQELPYKLMPIDTNKLVLDSDDVLKLFMESPGGVEYLNTHSQIQIDYRLVHLEGYPNPIWTLFDVSGGVNTLLFNVDSVTGLPVEDPFAKLLQ